MVSKNTGKLKEILCKSLKDLMGNEVILWDMGIDISLLQPRSILKTIHDLYPESISTIVKFDNVAGYSATLINLESVLVEEMKDLTGCRDEDVKPWLKETLRMRFSTQRPEIQGKRVRAQELQKFFLKTLREISALLQEHQRLIIIFDCNGEMSTTELKLRFSYLFNNLPKQTKIIVTKTENHQLVDDKFHYQPIDGYYWNHPIHLGQDIHFLRQRKAKELINFLTLETIVILLRLWDMSDIAVPAFKDALNLLSKFQTQFISLSSSFSLEPGYNIPVGVSDKYLAEFHLCRELMYYMYLWGNLAEAERYRSRALIAIDKSKAYDSDQAVLKSRLWGDVAQAAREDGNLDKAVQAIERQIELCKVGGYEGENYLRVIIHNLGIVQKERGQYLNALSTFKELLEIDRTDNDLSGELDALLEIGRINLELNKSRCAMDTFDRILERSQLVKNNQHMKGIALGYKAIIYLKTERLMLAKRHAQEALKIFRIVGAIDDIKKAEQLLAEIEKKFD